MKNIRHLLMLILAIIFVFGLVGCQLVVGGSSRDKSLDVEEEPSVDPSYDEGESGIGRTDIYPSPSDPSSFTPLDPIWKEGVSGIISPDVSGYDGYEPALAGDKDTYHQKSGQLTASALFDHQNYGNFLELCSKGQTEDGVFYRYKNNFDLVPIRISLKINNGPLAKVELKEDDKVIYATYADKNGQCYLFSNKIKDEYQVTISYNETLTQDFIVQDGDEITLSEESSFNNKIEIMFIIDTTGSMGDEIQYLKAEIKDVIERISTNTQNDVSLALLFYRDKGDKYVTLYSDFTEDIDAQVAYLGNQTASGGGDFPEAVQDAFKEAVNKQWSSGPSTKIVVHVADAPSHDEDVKDWFSSVNLMAEKGIRIINVASSGIDKKTEYFYRSQCILTNGCYAYLTNHSGIGGSHIEASTDEVLPVELLNDLLVRVITGFHTGEMGEPIDYRQSTNNNQEEKVDYRLDAIKVQIKEEYFKQVETWKPEMFKEAADMIDHIENSYYLAFVAEEDAEIDPSTPIFDSTLYIFLKEPSVDNINKLIELVEKLDFVEKVSKIKNIEIYEPTIPPMFPDPIGDSE